MAALKPNDFQDALRREPMFTNGDSQRDQFGDPYRAVPVEFYHVATTTVPNAAINAARIASVDDAEKSWSQRAGEFFGKTKAIVSKIFAFSPVVQVARATSAAPEAAKKSVEAVKRSLWKLAFLVVLVFVGYFFMKTVAVRYAGKL